MTLIASFEVNACPILIGDILITSETGRPGASTPFVHDVNLRGINFKVSGLSQKLIIISDDMVFAWAGSRLKARILAKELRAFCEGRAALQLDELHRYITEMDGFDFDGLDVIIYVHDSSDEKMGVLSNLAVFDLGPFKDLRVSGSGQRAFTEAAVAWYGYMREYERAPSPYQEAIGKALGYIANSGFAQLAFQVGLADKWGGGFELVWYNRKFEKCDRLLWLCWAVEVVDGAYYLYLKPGFLYQYQQNDASCMWLDEGPAGETRLYVVTAPDKPISRDDVESTLPDILIPRVTMNLIQMPDGTANVFLDMQPTNPRIEMQLTENKITFGINADFLVRVSAQIGVPISGLVTRQ